MNKRNRRVPGDFPRMRIWCAVSQDVFGLARMRPTEPFCEPIAASAEALYAITWKIKLLCKCTAEEMFWIGMIFPSAERERNGKLGGIPSPSGRRGSFLSRETRAWYGIGSGGTPEIFSEESQRSDGGEGRRRRGAERCGG